MKTRVLTAVVGLPIVFFVLYFFNTPVLNIAVAFFSSIAVYEMLINTKYIRHRILALIGILQAIAAAFLNFDKVANAYPAILLISMMLMVLVLFLKHDTINFKEVVMTYFVSFVVSYAFCCLIFLRDAVPGIGPYMLFLVFTCSWICDAGAYFTGLRFGKRKLAPTISPKKTVEGAIGGVVVCIAFNIMFTYVYMLILTAVADVTVDVHFFTLTCVIALASMIGIVGDLTASIIKRQCGLKDFGTIFPGHGGVMDRFDSTLFIAPFLYIAVLYFPIVTIL